MQKIDALLLGTNLNALAEAFDKKPVSPKALEIWFDTLREFPTENVMGVLTGWPKMHGKFPTPAEVWKLANDAGAERRERMAEADRVAGRRQAVYAGATEQGKRLAKQVLAVCNSRRPSAAEHWRRVLASAPVESIGYQYAQEATAVLSRKRMVREPGEGG